MRSCSEKKISLAKLKNKIIIASDKSEMTVISNKLIVEWTMTFYASTDYNMQILFNLHCIACESLHW